MRLSPEINASTRPNATPIANELDALCKVTQGQLVSYDAIHRQSAIGQHLDRHRVAVWIKM